MILLIIEIFLGQIALAADLAEVCSKDAIKSGSTINLITPSETRVGLSLRNQGPAPLIFLDTLMTTAERLRRKLLETLPSKLIPKTLLVVVTSEAIRGGALARFCPELQVIPEEATLLIDPRFLQSDETLLAIGAHEIFHWSIFSTKTQLPNWLEEGLALEVQSLMSPRSVASAVKEHLVVSPETTLNRTQEEIVSGDLSLAYSSYGHAYLFVRFLERNFTKPLAQTILESPSKDGLATLKSLLSERGTTLEEQFLKFSIAKYINQPDYLLSLDERSQPNLVARDFKTELVRRKSCPTGLNVACLLEREPKELEPFEQIAIFQINGAGHTKFCKTLGDCDSRLGTPFILLVRTHF